MIVELMAMVVSTAVPSCAVGNGNGYTASLIAPPAAEALPLKPVVVAQPKPKVGAKPHRKRAKLSLGCSSRKKG